MRSVRFDEELDAKVRLAAERSGETVSEFPRAAAGIRADEMLDQPHLGVFDDVIGTANGGGGRARRSGDAFTDVLLKR